MNYLDSISPIDGRYRSKVVELADFFSERALNRHRLLVEVEWLIFLSDCGGIDALGEIDPETQKAVRDLPKAFDREEARSMKEIEDSLGHDVKAVEYYLKRKLKKLGLGEEIEMVHFLCTSEDINNLSYALMIDGAVKRVMLPAGLRLLGRLLDLAKQNAKTPMISRTHGQPASPTTLGKEIFVFCDRLLNALEKLNAVKPLGKINGAVGNFNAHFATYPDLDWPKLSRKFTERLGLTWNPVTTQIEPHDWICELCMGWSRWNSVLLDMCRDFWGYIAMEDLVQSFEKGTVGSSTMPHKVNPIQFENSEANLGISNAIFDHLAAKLPVSRWQRDLSDSSALRNLGTAFAHALLAIKSCEKGLGSVAPNRAKLEKDLENSWELLGEAIQSVMRKHGIEKPYEKMKELTQGKKPDQKTLRSFVAGSELPADEKKRLMNMTPSDYLGNACSLMESEVFDQALARLSSLRVRNE